jgi:hypothetical protein
MVTWWLRYYAISRKVAGSGPDEMNGYFCQRLKAETDLINVIGRETK